MMDEYDYVIRKGRKNVLRVSKNKALIKLKNIKKCHIIFFATKGRNEE